MTNSSLLQNFELAKGANSRKVYAAELSDQLPILNQSAQKKVVFDQFNLLLLTYETLTLNAVSFIGNAGLMSYLHKNQEVASELIRNGTLSCLLRFDNNGVGAKNIGEIASLMENGNIIHSHKTNEGLMAAARLLEDNNLRYESARSEAYDDEFADQLCSFISYARQRSYFEESKLFDDVSKKLEKSQFHIRSAYGNISGFHNEIDQSDEKHAVQALKLACEVYAQRANGKITNSYMGLDSDLLTRYPAFLGDIDAIGEEYQVSHHLKVSLSKICSLSLQSVGELISMKPFKELREFLSRMRLLPMFDQTQVQHLNELLEDCNHLAETLSNGKIGPVPIGDCSIRFSVSKNSGHLVRITFSEPPHKNGMSNNIQMGAQGTQTAAATQYVPISVNLNDD